MSIEGPRIVAKVEDYSTEPGETLEEAIALRTNNSPTTPEASSAKQDNPLEHLSEQTLVSPNEDLPRSPILESGPPLTEATDDVKVFPAGDTTPLTVFEKPRETDATQSAQEDLSEKVLHSTKLFSEAVLGRLKNAPETVRSATAKAYEGLSSVPFVGHALGKMEMAYSQYWVDHHESNALRLKATFDRHDATFKTLEQSQKEIELQMQELATAGIPGADSLQLFLQKIDKEKSSVLQKRDAAEGKIKDRQEKITNYTEKRDRIANRFIAEYDEKLQPHQERMRELDISKAECDFEISSAKARHDQELSELNILSDKKNMIVSALLKAGMSQRKIDANLAVVNIDKHITEGRNRVRFEMEKLDAKLAKVKYETAQIKKKSSPYVQKRTALERLKNGRRVQINLPTTETVVAQTEPAEPTAETPDIPDSPATPTENQTSATSEMPQADNDNTPVENRAETLPNQAEASVAVEEAPKLETPKELIQALNNHLRKVFAKQHRELHIDTDEFIKKTRLKPNTKLSAKSFKQLVNKYYQTKGVDKRLRLRALDSFNNMSTNRTVTA